MKSLRSGAGEVIARSYLRAARLTAGRLAAVQIGAHVSTAGGIHTAIDRAVERGADALQLFTQSPRMWRPTNHAPESIEAFKRGRAEHGIGGAVSHTLYLVNLASPNDDVYRHSVGAMPNTMDVPFAIEADAVIFP